MKAKDWYKKLADATSQEEFENVLENCLKNLCDDAMNLINIRKAKSDNAVSACIKEVNNKWSAICRMLESDKENKKFADEACQMNVYLDNDGFKAAFIQLHPKYGWCFDLEAHKRKIEVKQQQISMKNLHNPTLILLGLTPLTEINEEFLQHKVSEEIMKCLYTLSTLKSTNFGGEANIVFMHIVAYHIHLLKCWRKAGKSDMEDIENMYKPWVLPQEYLVNKYQVEV